MLIKIHGIIYNNMNNKEVLVKLVSEQKQLKQLKNSITNIYIKDYIHKVLIYYAIIITIYHNKINEVSKKQKHLYKLRYKKETYDVLNRYIKTPLDKEYVIYSTSANPNLIKFNIKTNNSIMPGGKSTNNILLQTYDYDKFVYVLYEIEKYNLKQDIDLSIIKYAQLNYIRYLKLKSIKNF